MRANPGTRRMQEPCPASIHASKFSCLSVARLSAGRTFSSDSNRFTAEVAKLSARRKVTCWIKFAFSKWGRYPRLCHRCPSRVVFPGAPNSSSAFLRALPATPELLGDSSPSFASPLEFLMMAHPRNSGERVVHATDKPVNTRRCRTLRGVCEAANSPPASRLVSAGLSGPRRTNRFGVPSRIASHYLLLTTPAVSSRSLCLFRHASLQWRFFLRVCQIAANPFLAASIASLFSPLLSPFFF